MSLYYASDVTRVRDRQRPTERGPAGFLRSSLTGVLARRSPTDEDTARVRTSTSLHTSSPWIIGARKSDHIGPIGVQRARERCSLPAVNLPLNRR